MTKSNKKYRKRNNINAQLTDAFLSFVKGAAAGAAAEFTSGLGRDDGDASRHGEAGRFDAYLLALSWSPRFCCTNLKQCKAERMAGLDDVSTHGLWPAYLRPEPRSGRTYPANCAAVASPPPSDGFDAAAAAALRGRAQHEWRKHGTCAKLATALYFAEEARVAASDELGACRECLRDAVADGAGAVSVADVLDSLGGPKRAALMADKHCRLGEITTCWAKKADGTVGAQIDCPDHLLGSARNSAVLSGCQRVHLDAAGSCTFITKEMLRALKRPDAA